MRKFLLILFFLPMFMPTSAHAFVCKIIAPWDGASFNNTGQAAANAEIIAEKFTVASNCVITAIGFNTSRINTRSDQAQGIIYADNSGSPGTTIETGSSFTITNTSDGANMSWATSTFAGTNTLNAGTTYWIGLTGTVLQNLDLIWANTGTSITLGDTKCFNGTTWGTSCGGFGNKTIAQAFEVDGNAPATGGIFIPDPFKIVWW